jgi:Na+/H+ antiporter NhaD/arsenite permease-like protein
MTMTALSPPEHRARAGWLGTRRRSIVAQASRCLGALAVLATGIAHIEQYSVDHYSTVPTIGTLFLLNFIAAIVIAVGLIAPLRRVTGRYTDLVRAVPAVGGIGLGVGSLAGLFVSETTGLFGFVEHAYRMAIVVAILVEVAATVLLVAFLLANGTGRQKIRTTLTPANSQRGSSA